MHNYTEYNQQWNLCSAFNPSKCTHTWSSGQPTLRHPRSSWGFGALLKGLTSVVVNSCRSRDSNPQHRVTSPTLPYMLISYKRDVLERLSLSEVKMGRDSPICERVRKKIVEYFKNNVPQRQIAKALQISSSTVHHVLWAKAHLKWTVSKWKSILWSESKFDILVGNHGRRLLRAKRGGRASSVLSAFS